MRFHFFQTLSFCSVLSRYNFEFEFKKLIEDEHRLKKGTKDKEMILPCVPYQRIYPVENIFKLETNELLLKPPQKLCIKNVKSEEINEIEKLKKEIENLKMENDALKAVSRKWSYWFKDVRHAVDNFPSLEEVDKNVDVNNCLITLLLELQKNLVQARRRMRSYKKKSKRLEKMLLSESQDNLNPKNCSEDCSCEQIQSEISCRCSSFDNINDQGEKSQISSPRSSISVSKISEHSKDQSKEELVKLKLFKKSKDEGYSYKDYIKIKTEKFESKINKIEIKEKILKKELKDNKKIFNTIQDNIEILRENGGTDEQFRSKMIEQKQIAKIITKIDKLLQECSYWKQKYLNRVMLLKKSVQN